MEIQTVNAQIEREEVARIAEEVGHKQRDTEADLAKTEPSVKAVMHALNICVDCEDRKASVLCNDCEDFSALFIHDTCNTL